MRLGGKFIKILGYIKLFKIIIKITTIMWRRKKQQWEMKDQEVKVSKLYKLIIYH